MTTEVVNFGCRLNIHEGEVMRAHAMAAGLDDAVIVNTCAVTAEAERQARQAIRRLRRERPAARIIVTGCAAQIDAPSFAAMPEVDRVIGNKEKLKADSWTGLDPVAVGDIMEAREAASHLVEGFDDRTRAFLQIQNGCDHRCTFCIIPFGRGNSRSVPLGSIVDQARALVAAGYAEIVLTGVDITSYGADLPGRPTLGQAIRRLLNLVPDLQRLRLSSLDVVEIDGELMRLIAEEPRLMPHLHLSLQAGHDLILKRMKRRHLRADAVRACAEIRARRPDTVFGADLIAGFPTEDEPMFQATLDLVGECDLTWLHVFPYSARPGTPAARMPQVPGDVRRERAGRLRALGERQVAGYFDRRIGGRARVLVERSGTAGRDDHHAPVRLADAVSLPPGRLVATTIVGAADGHLIGRVAA
ncbi:MAG: tRNA (N(6)-L-threonylcarbamoyladenosine(37)-C(2))-methylthiotransferase MtaB [Alphaproteobacteria bacterium]|nr:tRNA (N(6)-L-threonylcarbamoyladenosine(37)-C(2))-methylthiotransferase MtaB [Alphaproteobacteria bacterium]